MACLGDVMLPWLRVRLLEYNITRGDCMQGVLQTCSQTTSDALTEILAELENVLQPLCREGTECCIKAGLVYGSRLHLSTSPFVGGRLAQDFYAFKYYSNI